MKDFRSLVEEYRNMVETVKFNGKTFTKYKTFNSDREANKFLEKNDDYGVIGVKGGKVYVSNMDYMGEELDMNESEDYFRHKGRLTTAGPTEKVHIDKIEPGDTVYHNGKARTVTKKDIGYDSTMGKTIFGDSYKLGKQEVERVLFKKWSGTNRKSFKWVAQP